MMIITITLFVEYRTSKSISKRDRQLLPPCYITWQNPSYNLVFIAVPMGILMTCKLKILWELGAIGFIPISETVFNLAIYGMQQLWKQHYTIIILGFACTCLQLLLIDFCNNDTNLPFRCVIYFCVQVLLELVQILHVYFFNPNAYLFQSTDFSTFNSNMIFLMDLASIWSNTVYTQSVFQTTYPESISPFWFDIICSSFIWVIFSISYTLQHLNPSWKIWSVHRIDNIDQI